MSERLTQSCLQRICCHGRRHESTAMLATLILGLMLGLQHATEADHLAAVVSLASGQTRPRNILLHGVSWGLGHAAMLIAVVGLLLVFGHAVHNAFSVWLDFGVAAMLIGLGLHVLYRLWQGGVLIHAHHHHGTAVHVHAHSHMKDNHPHAFATHVHPHPAGLPLRAFVVGLMHGLSGSAALVVLAASSMVSLPGALSFVALFALGTLVGMSMLTAIIALPFSFSARVSPRVFSGLQLMIGMVTIGVGLHLICLQYLLAFAA